MADVDRISELPESILHRILSSLSQKQSIQTSALSKTWRHVGPTRPKIELRQSSFESCRQQALVSVLVNTLRTYNHRNLSVHEFIFEMCLSDSDSDYEDDWNDNEVIDSESISILDEHIPILLTDMGLKKFDFAVAHYFLAPSVVFRAEFLEELCLTEVDFLATANDNDQPLFKGLKRLSLNKVLIEDETLEKIIRTCPLIEYLSLSGCVGSSRIFSISLYDRWSSKDYIPVTLNIPVAEFLAELDLRGIRLIATDLLLSTKLLRLKTLTLVKVNVQDETLEKIVSSCPSIERLLLSKCEGLTNIKLNWSYGLSIEIDGRLNWYGEYFYFPRLESLRLTSVTLSEEFFESISSSSSFPCLEELVLRGCDGFRKIHLSVCSVKRLVIDINSTTDRLTITIYAPSIRLFKLSVSSPPRLNFHTEGLTEWKSEVFVSFYRDWKKEDIKDSILPWLVQLGEVMASLSESEISLDVNSGPFENLRDEDTSDCGLFCKKKPVVFLEHVSVREDRGGDGLSSFADFLNRLFLVCRPRCVGTTLWGPIPLADVEQGRNKLVEHASMGGFWDPCVEGISMQVWDEKSSRWGSHLLEDTYYPGFTQYNLKIRFLVKWRD